MNITEELRNTLAQATPRISLDNWIGLRREGTGLIEELSSAEADERNAEQRYYAIAPFGTMSTMFMDSSKKSLAKAAKIQYEHVRQKRETLQQKLTNNRGSIRVACEYFLRDAMRPDTLKLLCDDPTFSPMISPILKRTADQAAVIWQKHSAAQSQSIAAITDGVAALGAMYRATSADPTRLLSVKE